MSIDDVLTCSPVIPVVTLTRAGDGVQVARALLEGGVGIIEVTLRTEAGLAAIHEIRTQVPGICVGAGSVWNPVQYEAALEAGAQFLVSPGAPVSLLDLTASRKHVPYLPGVQTVTEAHRVLEAGHKAAKFFPAETSGGVASLRAICSVLPDLRFCPTGGIDLVRAPSYLALGQVACVGGSWLAPPALVTESRWAEVTRVAAESVHTLRNPPEPHGPISF